MEVIREGLILTAEGMAATFVICAAVIALSVLVRLIAENPLFVKGAQPRAPTEEHDQLINGDAEKTAVIAAVAAVMDDAPFRVRSIRYGGDSPGGADGDNFGGEWERSVREEAARTQGGDR